MVVRMTQKEEDALFEKRVKQINRDCLQTFLPYIKAVIGILLTVGVVFLSLTIWFYQDVKIQINGNSRLLHEIKENQSVLKYNVHMNDKEILNIRKKLEK